MGYAISKVVKALRCSALIALASINVFAQSDTRISIMAHVQNRGWIGPFSAGQVAGTVGQSLRLEAVTLVAYGGRHICYQAHVQNIGWQNEVCDGAVAGTTGRSLRMEAIRIRVDKGHVAYFGHVQNIGWMGPFRDGEIAGTTGRSLRLEAISVQISDGAATTSGSAKASTYQTAVLRVERDVFRHGGWGFKWRSPTPYNDQYNYGEAGIQLRLSDIIPANSRVTSAVLTWSFTGMSAKTDANRPNPGAELGGNHARSPRIHGSNTACSGGPCSPAAIDHWGPDAAHWPNRIQLNGQRTYWFPAPQSRDYSGSIDLLSIYPATALAGNTLTFFGTLQYGVGRPFFATEGWNADTEFDVLGQAETNVSATVTVMFTIPAAMAAPRAAVAGGLPPVSAKELPDIGGGATSDLPSVDAVLNSASLTYGGGGLVSGSLVTVTGRNLTDGTSCLSPIHSPVPGDLVPSECGSTARVLVNGLAATVVGATPDQLLVVLPEYLLAAAATLQVSVGELTSSPVTFAVAAASPGVFSLNSNGIGQGDVVIAGTSILAAPLTDVSRPAKPGDIVSVFVTGVPAVIKPALNGEPAETAVEVSTPILVTIGGVSTIARRVTPVPCRKGVYQVDIEIPGGTPAGDAVELTVQADGVVSNTVTLAIGSD